MQIFDSESSRFGACSVTVQLTAMAAEYTFCSMLLLASGSKCKSCGVNCFVCCHLHLQSCSDFHTAILQMTLYLHVQLAVWMLAAISANSTCSCLQLRCLQRAGLRHRTASGFSDAVLLKFVCPSCHGLCGQALDFTAALTTSLLGFLALDIA